MSNKPTPAIDALSRLVLDALEEYGDKFSPLLLEAIASVAMERIERDAIASLYAAQVVEDAARLADDVLGDRAAAREKLGAEFVGEFFDALDAIGQAQDEMDEAGDLAAQEDETAEPETCPGCKSKKG